MGFIEDYKQLMYSLLDSGEYDQAKMLQMNARKLKESYDEEVCYLESLVAYSSYQFVLALFWAEKGYQMNPDYVPIQKMIEMIHDTEIDFKNYTPTFSEDVSFLKKKLRIVLHCGLIPIMDFVVYSFKDVFESLGHEVFMYRHDIGNEIHKQFEAFFAGGIDGSICFNNAGWFLGLSDYGNLCDHYHIPNLNYLFDHPFFYEESMKKAPKEGSVSCVDRKQSEFIKRFYPTVKNTFFFPLAGEELPELNYKPWRERSINILYVGSLKISGEVPNDKFSNMVFEKLTSETHLMTDEAIIQVFQDLTEEEMALYFPQYMERFAEVKTDEHILRDVIEKYCKVDLNVNSVYRAGAVLQLAKAGIPVTVYGNGWESLSKTNENIHYMGVISPSECIEKICDSKIVLNSMPWFKAGFHDRIANAMLNKAVCITDPSEYLLQRYEDQEDIVYYSLNQMEQLPSIVLDILNNEDKAEYIIENAYRKAQLTETWQNRGIEYISRLMNNDFT